MSHIGRQPIIIHTAPTIGRPVKRRSVDKRSAPTTHPAGALWAFKAGEAGPAGPASRVRGSGVSVRVATVQLQFPTLGAGPTAPARPEALGGSSGAVATAQPQTSGRARGAPTKSFIKITASRGFTMYCPSSFLLQKRLDFITQTSSAGPEATGDTVAASGIQIATRQSISGPRAANLECSGSLRSLLSQMVQDPAGRMPHRMAPLMGAVGSSDPKASAGAPADGSKASGGSLGGAGSRRLTIQGVGYRAETISAPALRSAQREASVAGSAQPLRAERSGTVLRLFVGYGHPVDIVVPSTITVQCPNPTTILVNGDHYQEVAQFVAKVRLIRPVRPGSPLPAAKKGIAHAS